MTGRIIIKHVGGWEDRKHNPITPRAGDRVDIMWSCWRWKFDLPNNLDYVQQGSYAVLIKKEKQDD